MAQPSLRELVVVVPHGGLVIPYEIPLESLSERLPALLRNVDWHTAWLYDFRDLLQNRHLVFPYLSLMLESNRQPQLLRESVPLADVYDEPIYRPQKEPTEERRSFLAQKYLVTFHRQIEEAIRAGGEFLLDGHSTAPARGVASNQIDLMNFQQAPGDDGPRHYSPNVFVETYAEELQRRLPEVRVTINASEYWSVHGHVCAEHSVNAMGRVGRRVPAILQETCDGLYTGPDQRPQIEAIHRLRVAFAESIRATVTKVSNLRKARRMIELRGQRQSAAFDCGATALQTVMAYYGVEERVDVLLKEMGTDPDLGAPVDRMIAVAERRQFRVESGSSWSIDDVKRHLDEERPVIVLLQAWAKEYMTLKDWRNDYNDGHYAVVVGYNEHLLFFEDPASFHRMWLKENEFLARWHDRDPVTGERLERFGMVLLGREPVAPAMRHME